MRSESRRMEKSPIQDRDTNHARRNRPDAERAEFAQPEDEIDRSGREAGRSRGLRRSRFEATALDLAGPPWSMQFSYKAKKRWEAKWRKRHCRRPRPRSKLNGLAVY